MYSQGTADNMDTRQAFIHTIPSLPSSPTLKIIFPSCSHAAVCVFYTGGPGERSPLFCQGWERIRVVVLTVDFHIRTIQIMSRSTLLLATAAAFAVSVNAGAVDLNPDNFDSEISGKGAFVKFLAPW